MELILRGSLQERRELGVALHARLRRLIVVLSSLWNIVARRHEAPATTVTDTWHVVGQAICRSAEVATAGRVTLVAIARAATIHEQHWLHPAIELIRVEYDVRDGEVVTLLDRGREKSLVATASREHSRNKTEERRQRSRDHPTETTFHA